MDRHEETTLGFEIRSVGLNPYASEYAGMSSKRTIVLSMVISGGLAGLGGVVEGLGTYQNFFVQTTSLSIGFDGMAVIIRFWFCDWDFVICAIIQCPKNRWIRNADGCWSTV